MHGYQLMQAIAERTGDAWRPSAGAIYPTIAQLEDEGLAVTSRDGGRRLVTLTDAGEAFLAERAEELGDPFAAFADRDSAGDLHLASRAVQVAVRQVAVGGDEDQLKAAATVLERARRELYLLLAGELDNPAEGEG